MRKEDVVIAAAAAMDTEELERLVRAIAAQLGAGRRDAAAAAKSLVEAQGGQIGERIVRLGMEAVLETIGESVARGDSVTLTGFGTFEPRERGERAGINPQTKAPMQISARRSVGFRPGRILRSRVAQTA